MTSEQINQYVQHLMSIHVGFLNGVPPGVSVEVKQVSRTGASGKDLVVKYHIFVRGVPPETLFQELNWPVTAEKPSSELGGISAGKDGLLMCTGRTEYQCGSPKKLDDPIEFTMTPRKGETYRFAFVSDEIKVPVVVVPDPIESTNRGCTLSAVRLTAKFELAFISGSGYPPNSDVHYSVSTNDASNDFVVKSDERGIIRTGVVPYSKDQHPGIAKVKVTQPECSPEVSFEWGKI